MIVAIDGPAGAGKGTVARALADRLGFDYVDTGALYRALALACLQSGVDPGDEAAAGRLARATRVELTGGRVLLDGADVTDRIRDDDVTAAVSSVAAQPEVRSALIGMQRAFLSNGRDVVMEGRDIGTTVAPHADVKIFLIASEEERARRRALQLGLGAGADVIESVRRDMARRDAADAARPTSPFQQPPDAVVLDSTGKAVDDVIDEVQRIVEEARSGSRG
jgi:cytidylate kinase